MKCKVCKNRFKPRRSEIYIVKETQGAMKMLAEGEKRFYTQNCPKCGCQATLGEHLEPWSKPPGNDK